MDAIQCVFVIQYQQLILQNQEKVKIFNLHLG